MTQELEIECGSYSKYKVLIEVENSEAFAKAKDHPAVQGKTGEELVTVLLDVVLPPEGILSVSRKNANDKYNDGPKGEPAYKKFNPAKAIARTQWTDNGLESKNYLVVAAEKHYKDDKLNDPSNGTPAVQVFSESTGELTLKAHYKDGLLNDAPDGEAAYQKFDDDGELLLKQYYRDEKLNDSPNGEPAWWGRDAETGDIEISHFKDGEKNNLPDGTPAYQKFTSSGKLVLVNYNTDNRIQDAPDGTPAVLGFNKNGGGLYAAWRYKGGEKTEFLKNRALRKIEKKPTIQALKKRHL